MKNATKKLKPILIFGTNFSFIENAYADDDEKEYRAESDHKEEKNETEDISLGSFCEPGIPNMCTKIKNTITGKKVQDESK